MDGESKGTSISAISNIDWGKWYTLDFYGILTHNLNGLFRVYLDNKKVWERVNKITGSERGGSPQIQYGIYAVAGSKLRTRVRELLWETINIIPNQDNLNPPSPAPSPAPSPTPLPPELDTGLWLVTTSSNYLKNLKTHEIIEDIKEKTIIYVNTDLKISYCVFYLNNEKYSVENNSPYSMSGDVNGKLNQLLLPRGSNIIKVEAYDALDKIIDVKLARVSNQVSCDHNII